MAATTKDLKIGLVLDASLDPADGVQQYVIAIGEWLRSQGHDVHYLVGQTARRDLPNIHSLSRNIQVRFNGNRGTMPLPTSRAKLRRFLETEQFDVLHVQVPYSPFMAHQLIQAAGPQTAIVGTFHIAPYNQLVSVANRALGIWLKSSLRQFDKMVSVSAAAADFSRQTFHVETEVLPNVVDYRRFHSAKPLSAYRDKTLTILFLGRLVPRKGCQVLLQAVGQLAGLTDIPKFRVLVCGKGPEAAKLQRFVAKHGLEKTVTFVGFVSEADKPRYYASADIAVFPSSAGESFGIVLIEALASGQAAVLAGDNPGYRSVLEERPELLFDPRDSAELTDKLAQYLSNRQLRHGVAHWGEDYSHNFDTGLVGKKLVDIYAQALRKRRQR